MSVATFHPNPSTPSVALPAHACDAHVHVFGPASRFAYEAALASPPVDAPKERLFALHRHLGIARCVVVQSLVHGFDNAVVEDTIAAGEGRYLGVALVRAAVDDTELRRLAMAGFRGVRFHFMGAAPTVDALEDLLRFAARLVPLRMHLQLHFRGEYVHRLTPFLARSPVPVVVDHMARVNAELGVEHADFAGLHSLLKHAHIHVKVSGVDRVTQRGHYAAGVPLAQALVRDYPHQCVWGTDWPHPNHDHVPDDGVLVDLLTQIAPGVALQRLLVDNPERLYRFEA